MKRMRLGFDLGSSSLKIAVLQGGKFRIEEARLPEAMEDETGTFRLPPDFGQFLRQTKRELSLPRGPAALVLPSSQSICRLVTMPPMTTEQLMLNLSYEFLDFIQGSAEEYHYDYAVCTPGEDDDESRGIPMMAAVAAKQTLTEYAQVFAQAGFKLKTVLPQEMSLIQLCQARGGDTEEFCFLDLGRRFTRITVVWRDRIQATRQIALGVRHLEEPPDSQTHAEVCERIAVEILKVINFYQFTHRSSALTGVYLTGGGAAVPVLRQSIESTVGLPLLDPAGLLPEAGEQAAAGVLAAGAAMGGIG